MLAAELGMEADVARLTDSAMNGDRDLADVYGARLELLNPSRTQVMALKSAYKRTAVPHAKATIAALLASDVDTWIISGGLVEPVREFGVWLGVEPGHVQAVGVEFDPLAGEWWSNGSEEMNYLEYRSGHLTATTGKGDVLDRCVTRRGRRLMVGDGMSDAAAGSSVDLFVAFAGVVDRPQVTRNAPVVIRSESLAPVLVLALGPSEAVRLLDTPHRQVALAALEAIDDGALEFNDSALGRTFAAALSMSRGS